MSLIRREPAAFYSILMGLATAVLVALPAFGVDLTGDQLGAAGSVLSAVLVLALSIITGTVIRAQVTPADQVVWQLKPDGGLVQGAAPSSDQYTEAPPQNAYDDDRDGIGDFGD